MCFLCVRSELSDDSYTWLSHQNTQEKSVTETQDAAADASTAYAVQPGDVFYGSRNSYDDRDWIAVDLVAGENYVFSMSAQTMRDPHLSLFGPNSALVAYSDDIDTNGGNYDSEITYTASQTGKYFLQASSYYLEDQTNSDDLGDYVVTVNAGGPGSGAPLGSIEWNYQSPTQINVYFVPGGHVFNDGYNTLATSNFDQNEIAQSMLAFEEYEAVANISINRVTSPEQADFFMVETTSDSWLGYWGVGGGAVSLNGISYSLDGWGVFANNGTGWTSAGLEQGGYGFITLIHEIGHGLGLAHPHDTGGGSDIMQGVTSPFNSLGNSDLNQGIFTTMSYNDGWRTADHGTSGSISYGWQGTPMALDIAVLQDRYGANTSANSGDTTYILPRSNTTGTFYQSIWDSDGIDTIVQNDNVSAVIDLRPASLKYEFGGGGFVSYAIGIHGGFTIAATVTIENAVGGGQDDTLIGNSTDNALDGGAGNDTLYGDQGDDVFDASSEHRSGADVFYGGAGNDVYYIDNASDRIFEYADEGQDMLYSELGATFLDQFVEDVILTGATHANAYAQDGQAIDNRMTGNRFDNLLKSYAGADCLEGGAGDDSLYGGDGGDYLSGGIGNDWARGEAGDDTIVADWGDDWYLGGDGTDTLIVYENVSIYIDLRTDYARMTGLGNDLVRDVENFVFSGGHDFAYGNDYANIFNGNAGNDTLLGAAGNDLIHGGDDIDFLAGGLGDDEIFGGQQDDQITDSWGADVLDGSTGNDLIHSFEGGDIVSAGAGDDTVRGGRGHDVISGDDGNDLVYGDTVLFASAGEDTIIGGSGNDTLQGGFGADTFVFDLSEVGEDVIQRIDTGEVDFQVGIDRVKFTGVSSDFNISRVSTYWTDTADGALFEYQDLTILIIDVSASEFTADTFLFV